MGKHVGKMNTRNELFALQDKEYAAFQAKLTPTVPNEKFIGVRVPELRKLARKLYREGNYAEFLNQLPHEYYDENMLHGLIISEITDYNSCVQELERFLPYVDNWAVCDTMSPKVFMDNKEILLLEIYRWASSKDTYTSRFGMGMLMAHFLDDDFKPEYLEIPAAVKSDEYYVNMMVAWFFATALAKQWDAASPYIEKRTLSPWVHNKTIQKAIESYRITPKQKEILKKMKIRIVK